MVLEAMAMISSKELVITGLMVYRGYLCCCREMRRCGEKLTRKRVGIFPDYQTKKPEIVKGE